MTEGPFEAAAGAEAEALELAAEREAAERPDRLRSVAAVAIAVVSILGAVVAFRGSQAGIDADKLDTTAIQEQSTSEEIISGLQAEVDHDLTNLASFEEHTLAAKLLSNQSAAQRSANPALADRLGAEATSEQELARVVGGYFEAAFPTTGADGTVSYDADQALATAEQENTKLQRLQPDATVASAEAAHTRADRLLGLVTLFIAGLVFLTLSQFARRVTRPWFAGAGGLCALVGTALWIVVERTG